MFTCGYVHTHRHAHKHDNSNQRKRNQQLMSMQEETMEGVGGRKEMGESDVNIFQLLKINFESANLVISETTEPLVTSG